MEALHLKRFLLCLVLVAAVAGCTCATPALSEVPTAPESSTDQPTDWPTAGYTSATPAPSDVPTMPESPTDRPTAGWRTTTPEEQGLDPQLLARMRDAIDERRLDMHSVLIVRHGTIVMEEYFADYGPNTRHVLYSCTKSFISALIGIAIEEGAIAGVDQPVLGFFPDRTFKNVDSRKEEMTLEDLLTMRSGLDWEEGMPAYIEMYGSRDLAQYMLDKPMVAEPGSTFNYCSGCSHVMSIIIQETTDEGTLAFAQSRLFEPLGITNVYWELDGSGIANGGWGLELTPRDMAKFGYLYLNEGEWDGQQIVPVEWVRASTRQSVQVEDDVGYGYQWWVTPRLGLYAARGLYNQAIFVLPDMDTVVVFTADIVADRDVLLELVEEFIIPSG